MKIKTLPPQLIFLIILAFLLGIGNPFINFASVYSIDDEFESQRAAFEILNQRSLTQETYYPPLWAWVQLPFIILAILGLKIFSIYPSFEAIKQAVIFSPGMFLPIARILSALLSSLSLIWIYKLGELLHSKKLGFLAAVFFTLSFLRIELAHLGKVTSIFLFCSLGFVYFCLKLSQHLSKKDWYFALIFLSLSILSYQVGLALIPLLIITLILSKDWRAFLFRSETIITSLSIAILVGLIFFGLNPNFLQPNLEFINLFAPRLTLYEKIIYHSKVIFYYELPLLFFALLGSVKFFRLKKKQALLILIFGFLPFLLYFSIDLVFPRYVILLIPFIAISCAFWFINNLRKKTLPLLLILIWSLVLGLKFNYLTFQPTTLIQAKRWIETNISPISPVLSSKDHLGIIPSLSALNPIILYNPYYHQAQVSLIRERSLALDNMKNIQFLDCLTIEIPKEDLKNYLTKTHFDYIVVVYYDLSEKNQFIEQLPPWPIKLVKTFYPTSKYQDLKSPTRMENPLIELFPRNQLGPFVEIYTAEIKSETKAFDVLQALNRR